MKNTMLLCICAVATLSLLSCDDDFWSPGPPPAWNNTFFDPYLTGTWQLIQYNAAPVRGDDVNYMQFDRNGRGLYYYYQRGRLYSENIAYWCQAGGNQASTDQINIQYEDGTASTMNYWFSDRNTRLWMQWYTSTGSVTYVYAYITSIP